MIISAHTSFLRALITLRLAIIVTLSWDVIGSEPSDLQLQAEGVGANQDNVGKSGFQMDVHSVRGRAGALSGLTTCAGGWVPGASALTLLHNFAWLRLVCVAGFDREESLIVLSTASPVDSLGP